MKRAKLFFFACVAVVPALGDTFSIDPLTSTVLPGQSFSVNVDVSGISDLYAFQFDIVFNPAVVSAMSISEGGFLAAGGATFFIPGAVDNVDGSIAFTADTLLTAISGVSGGGTLATIQFSGTGAGSSPIGLSNVLLLDSALNDIPVSTVNGSATVVPEPSTWVMLMSVLAALVLLRRRLPV